MHFSTKLWHPHWCASVLQFKKSIVELRFSSERKSALVEHSFCESQFVQTLEFYGMNESITSEIEETQTAAAASLSSKKATLVEQDGVIGYLKTGESFQAQTNFTVEVVGCLKMEGSIVGYLFKVKRVDDDRERYLFLSVRKKHEKWICRVVTVHDLLLSLFLQVKILFLLFAG